MLVNGINYRSIWRDTSDGVVKIINQTVLPHKLEIKTIKNTSEAVDAIKNMEVRGAPLIGVTAAYGMALAMKDSCSDNDIINAGNLINASRPTAVNLSWAVNKVSSSLKELRQTYRAETAMKIADEMCDGDVTTNYQIGLHGSKIIEDLSKQKSDGSPVRILTHCNAGWLATVDRGTATAPIYQANENGINLEVWVDETRPRNQGAALTTWELMHNKINHTLIVDNAGGHLMQRGLVDLVIVGSDRTSGNGDVCNKIGTYLKALAAKANNIPFYASLPTSTIDWSISDGVQNIPIEERDFDEVTHVHGVDSSNNLTSVRICPESTKCANPSFDVTPNELVTGIITEKGVFNPRDLHSIKELP